MISVCDRAVQHELALATNIMPAGTAKNCYASIYDSMIQISNKVSTNGTCRYLKPKTSKPGTKP